MPESRFKLDWFAGASAQVELFSPQTGGTGTYQLKYTPPFRSTIRPPVEERPLSQGELAPINRQLNDLVGTLDARAAAGPEQPPAQPADAAIKKIELLGQKLLYLLIPYNIQTDLRSKGLFLEIGMDKELLNYPWELMHDGEDFLCLKHATGRFVNSDSMAIPTFQRPASYFGFSGDTLSVLLISVPSPQPRTDGTTYEILREAETETQAICDVLTGIEGVSVELLSGRNATHDEVFKAFKKGGYQIVHYNGHANFNDNNPRLSSLVLYDQDMTTGQVTTFFAKSPPILCFINACETARIAASKEWKDRYDIFGLARAFLDTGAYLLGSRWKINDKAAACFAGSFYKSLLQEGKPLGNAILEARKICKEQTPIDEFAWASYILYGDPRVCFRKLC